MLVDVAVVSTLSATSSECGDRLRLTINWTLCAKYANSSASTSFIGELRIQELGASTTLSVASQIAVNARGIRVQAIGTTDRQSTLVVLSRQHTGILMTEPLAASPASASSPNRDGINTGAPLVARQLASPARERKLRSEANAAATQGLTFKIVQLVDLHYTGDASYACRNPPQEMVDAGKICTEADTTAFVVKVLDAETPDFVVFTGDNIEVFKTNKLSDVIETLLGPVEARKIPYAVVFGNHDDENGQTRANIAQHIIGRKYSHMHWGPTSRAGVGKYGLSVKAPSDGPWGPKGSNVFPMYFLDSHGYANATAYPDVNSGYDWIKPDQVAYYKEMALANRKAYTAASSTASSKNAPPTLPAVVFFHIPIPEYASVGSAEFRSGEKNEKVEASESSPICFRRWSRWATSKRLSWATTTSMSIATNARASSCVTAVVRGLPRRMGVHSLHVVRV